MLEREHLLQHPGLAVLRKALVREARWQLIAAIALLVIGFSLISVFYKTNVIVSLLGLFMTITACRYIYEFSAIKSPDDHQLIHMISYEPERIVWVYGELVERLPFGLQFSRSGTLYFKLIDGDEIIVNIPGRHLRLVSKTLNRLLPETSFGFSSEKAEKFAQKPRLLRKSDQKGKDSSPTG
ncbi:MAG: hypothetical protein R2828_05865 [Saprospiraceae bacterium]